MGDEVWVKQEDLNKIFIVFDTFLARLQIVIEDFQNQLVQVEVEINNAKDEDND